MPLVAIADRALDVGALAQELAADGGVGAVATFVGLVRNQNAGRRVRYLEYEAYEPMAVRVLERILREAEQAWPGTRVAAHHRVGRLEIGEASVAIAAVSAHRGDAFAACRYTIERVKQILPVWKREHFDGGDVWLEGAAVHPDDEGARESAHRIACA
ncbi:MAG: molybdenum cofactor biosynthesis protein MoaE [Acidimicrobiia bacterium]|nr:molybdenum cofactor biosynthesis protein MoaE [Acidimicrobiia bacterium]